MCPIEKLDVKKDVKNYPNSLHRFLRPFLRNFLRQVFQYDDQLKELKKSYLVLNVHN